jgi:hypothetical protein
MCSPMLLLALGVEGADQVWPKPLQVRDLFDIQQAIFKKFPEPYKPIQGPSPRVLDMLSDEIYRIKVIQSNDPKLFLEQELLPIVMNHTMDPVVRFFQHFRKAIPACNGSFPANRFSQLKTELEHLAGVSAD